MLRGPGANLSHPPEPTSAQRSRRYRQAAWAYMGLGGVVLALVTLSPGLASGERRGDLAHLLVGLPFFLLFGIAIGWGDRLLRGLLRLLRVSRPRAEAMGRGAQTGLTLLLTLSGLGRTLVFAANGFGYQPRLLLDPVRFHLAATRAVPLMLLCALLMGLITFFLARASWWPLLRRNG